jgi:hypothetical protein
MAKPARKLASFPPPNIPTIFADGVLNVAHTDETVKFYLGRLDPSETESSGGPRDQAIAQVIMPVSAFLETVEFFSSVVDKVKKRDEPRTGTRSKTNRAIGPRR